MSLSRLFWSRDARKVAHGESGHPSRVPPANEAPFPPLLGIVAAQLKVTPAVWSQYARRDETRREHLQELFERLELRQFDRTTEH